MEESESPRSRHTVIGVDTHKHVRVAAVMVTLGGILATLTIATDSAGFRQLVEWATGFGKIIDFGVEGTGHYGAGHTSFVLRYGHKVVEVSRPARRLRRLNGKPDTLDAEHAARAVLAGFAAAVPKTGDATVEMIRQLKVAHDTAVKARTAIMVPLKAMLVHAPEQLQEETAGKDPDHLGSSLRRSAAAQAEHPTTHFGTRCARSHGVGSTSMTKPKTSAVSSPSLSTFEHRN